MVARRLLGRLLSAILEGHGGVRGAIPEEVGEHGECESGRQMV